MIRFEKLTKLYDQVVGVSGLDFEVTQGSIFGFLGPNGAGKTTTIRILMGLLAPSSGKAFIDGLDATCESMKVKSKVGYLPDEIFLYDYLTGRQFLEFVGEMRGIDDVTLSNRIDHYLDFFGLSDAAGEFTTNYSYGMKKKLALAGTVLHKPTVMILDEPFNGLDPQAIRDFQSLMIAMAKEGTTILFSSHVLVMVEKLVTHVGIISQGRMVTTEKLETLLKCHNGSLEKAFFTLTAAPR